MNFPDNYLFSLSFAFGGGIILSAIGSSILTVTIFAAISEMIHAYLIKFAYNWNETAIRLILYIASIVGFLIGREVILHDVEYQFF